MFYVYRQNNSGGFFTGPAINVIVEADSAEEANERASYDLIYFDGSLDCSCCGSRWYRAWSDELGYATEEEARAEASPSFYRPEGVPVVRVLRKEASA